MTKKSYSIKRDGQISSREEPEDWFRFEEPYKSPREGPSYVSKEDVVSLLGSKAATVVGAEFYRLRGKPGNYTLTPITDSSLVKKLAEHRQRLVSHRGYNAHMGSTGGFGLAEALRPLSELSGEF